MDVPIELRRAYLDAEVDLWLGGRDRPASVWRPAPTGTVDDGYPYEVATIHVLSAANPRSRRMPEEINRRRDRQLRTALTTTAARWVVRAVGRDVTSTWTELSWAVAGLDDRSVLELAARFDQHAVYVWTPLAREVLWSDGTRDATGWTLTPADRDVVAPR